MISDINITPFVDVMLVLLVVFMVSTPLFVSGLNVDLPEVKESNKIPVTKSFELTIYHDGTIYHADELVPYKNFPIYIKNNVNSMDVQFVVRGDRKVSYGMIMKVIGKISELGYNKISLVTKSD
jgi:biopolymer transport protein TolR